MPEFFDDMVDCGGWDAENGTINNVLGYEVTVRPTENVMYDWCTGKQTNLHKVVSLVKNWWENVTSVSIHLNFNKMAHKNIT